ncbi:MAG: hypothetical protein R2752_22070 [Vicinamibacterales bacterium]
MDTVASAVFFAAWPTATYRQLTFGGVTRAGSGVDVRVRLHGTSAFADGPLWTDVVLVIRDGRVMDLRFGANNGVVPPGLTTSLVGSVLAEISKELAESAAASRGTSSAAGATTNRGGGAPAAPSATPAWRLQPLMPGGWYQVSEDSTRGITTELTGTAFPDQGAVSRIRFMRALPLPFYPNGYLLEAETTTASGGYALLTFVRIGRAITWLDGTSAPIYQLNERVGLALDTAEQAAAYVRFFCAAIQDGRDRFVMVEAPQQLDWPESSAAVPARTRVRDAVGPLDLSAGSATWEARGAMLHQGLLSSVTLRVHRRGTEKPGFIEMVDEKVLAENIPARASAFVDALRQEIRR